MQGKPGQILSAKLNGNQRAQWIHLLSDQPSKSSRSETEVQERGISTRHQGGREDDAHAQTYSTSEDSRVEQQKSWCKGDKQRVNSLLQDITSVVLHGVFSLA